MRRIPSIALSAAAICLALGWLFCTTPALGLRCAEYTPVPGDSLQAVVAACGPATLNEHRKITVKETDANTYRTITTDIVELTYDSGPEEPMQTYHLENGILVSLTSYGYGRPYVDRGDSCRNGELLTVGDSEVNAYLKCGEPLAREQKGDKKIESEGNGTKRETTVSVVEWTYRYGPDLPGYTLRFEDGIVAEIRERAFGK